MPADEYHDDEDWYENQTGDSISGYKPGYRPRRGNYSTCFILGGIVLALGGLAVAMLAKGEKQKLEGSTLEPIRDKGPTMAPQVGRWFHDLPSNAVSNILGNWCLELLETICSRK